MLHNIKKKLNKQREPIMTNSITIPAKFQDFIQINSQIIEETKEYLIEGYHTGDKSRICPHCGCKMHLHDWQMMKLRHINIGSAPSSVRIWFCRYQCHSCGMTQNADIPFKVPNHFFTQELLACVEDLLAMDLSISQTAKITRLNVNIVKEIDISRLKRAYTDGNRLKKPESKSRYLAIDEFLLHKGHKYATIIIDLESGHVLWLCESRKKDAVYSFIRYVGLEWMKNVEAVACDMNSDFAEAFAEKCPHIRIVYDFFHIMKNFNDKVINAVRKDEQNRLIAEGDTEAAKKLKGTKYILTSSRKTLEKKDKAGAEGKVLVRSGMIFRREEVIAKLQTFFYGRFN